MTASSLSTELNATLALYQLPWHCTSVISFEGKERTYVLCTVPDSKNVPPNVRLSLPCTLSNEVIVTICRMAANLYAAGIRRGEDNIRKQFCSMFNLQPAVGSDRLLD